MSNLSMRGMRYAFLLLVISTHPSNSARAQGSPFVAAESAASEGAPPVVGGAANDIVSKVLTENERRSERLRGYKVTRMYQIITLEGKDRGADRRSNGVSRSGREEV